MELIRDFQWALSEDTLARSSVQVCISFRSIISHVVEVRSYVPALRTGAQQEISTSGSVVPTNNVLQIKARHTGMIIVYGSILYACVPQTSICKRRTCILK